MKPRGDLFGRVLGALILLGGLAVISMVLWLGFEMFQDPNLGLGATKSSTAADVGVGFGKLIVRILLLFLLSFSGSLIANKGVNLYFASLPGAVQHDEAPVKTAVVTEERESIRAKK
jgi:hypothetical protein